mgnify:CR=1 FL=1
MAHFAKISENNEVLTVLRINNSDMLDANGVEDETVGTPLRGNYGSFGYEWDEVNQIFWSIKTHASWVKHNASASWKSPIGDCPELTAEQISQNNNGTHRWSYSWNESNQSFDLIDYKT